MEVIEKRIEERNKIINEAKAYSKNLSFNCSVLLIGSYARGDFNLWSDIDLLIIGDFRTNLNHFFLAKKISRWKINSFI